MENMNLLEYMNQATALMGQEKYEAAITFLKKRRLRIGLISMSILPRVLHMPI